MGVRYGTLISLQQSSSVSTLLITKKTSFWMWLSVEIQLSQMRQRLAKMQYSIGVDQTLCTSSTEAQTGLQSRSVHSQMLTTATFSLKKMLSALLSILETRRHGHTRFKVEMMPRESLTTLLLMDSRYSKNGEKTKRS